VRLVEEDPTGGDLKAIQFVLNSTKIKDKVSIINMLKKFDLMSVNQINATKKLLEIWKSLNLKNYPLQVEQQSPKTETISTRTCTIGRLCEVGKSDILQKNLHQ
jgi:hypothetical protein